MDRLPEHLARGKFEPYLSVRRNEELKSAHRTFTKKDFVAATGVLAPIVYNENYDIDCNLEDVLKVVLYNDAPLLKDQAVAEGFINIRELTSGMAAGAGGLINSRQFELPLYSIAGTAHTGTTGTTTTGGPAHHGLVGTISSMLPGHHKEHATTTTTGTSATAAPVMGSTGMTGTGIPIAIAIIGIKLFDNNTFQSTGTTTGMAAPVGTTTGTDYKGSGLAPGAALAGGMVGGRAVGAPTAGGVSDPADPEGLARKTNPAMAGPMGGLAAAPGGGMQQPGQNTFDIRIGECTLDYAVLERLYGYKRVDIDSKITPYVMLRNGSDLSSSVKSSVCRFNQAANSYNFNTVLRTWASPMDKVYLYLVDDNLITRDTYLGYCPLPLSASGASVGSFQNLELQGMDPKHNRTASIPTSGMASFGRIGMVRCYLQLS